MKYLTAMAPTVRYRCLVPATVRTLPSKDGAIVRRLPPRHEFAGWPASDRRWIERAIGGYVSGRSVAVVHP